MKIMLARIEEFTGWSKLRFNVAKCAALSASNRGGGGQASGPPNQVHSVWSGDSDFEVGGSLQATRSPIGTQSRGLSG